MSEQEKTAALAEIEAARNQPPTLTEVAKMLAAKLEPLMEFDDYTVPTVIIASGVKFSQFEFTSTTEWWNCALEFEFGDYERTPVSFVVLEPTLPKMVAAMQQRIERFILEVSKKYATHE